MQETFKIFRNLGPASFEEVMGDDGLNMAFETEQEAHDFILEQKDKKTLRVARVSADGSTHILDAPTEKE